MLVLYAILLTPSELWVTHELRYSELKFCDALARYNESTWVAFGRIRVIPTFLAYLSTCSCSITRSLRRLRLFSTSYIVIKESVVFDEVLLLQLTSMFVNVMWYHVWTIILQVRVLLPVNIIKNLPLRFPRLPRNESSIAFGWLVGTEILYIQRYCANIGPRTPKKMRSVRHTLY